MTETDFFTTVLLTVGAPGERPGEGWDREQNLAFFGLCDQHAGELTYLKSWQSDRIDYALMMWNAYRAWYAVVPRKND